MSDIGSIKVDLAKIIADMEQQRALEEYNQEMKDLAQLFGVEDHDMIRFEDLGSFTVCFDEEGIPSLWSLGGEYHLNMYNLRTRNWTLFKGIKTRYPA